MNTDRVLSDGWELKRIDPREKIDAAAYGQEKEDWIQVKSMPAQVHDILYDNGFLDEEYRLGWCENVLWVGEYDWLYRCHFRCEDEASGAGLLFEGLDTYADIYLNGKLVGEHDNFYLPQEVKVSGSLQKENILLIHFHRVSDFLEREKWNPEWDGAVQKCKVIRKPIHDFPPEVPDGGSNYQGAIPYFSPIGVYGKVRVKTWGEARIEEVLAKVTVDEANDGKVRLIIKGEGGNTALSYKLYAGQELVQEGALEEVQEPGAEWSIESCFTVAQPSLWYPRGFGKPFRYRLEIIAAQRGNIVDKWERQIGFKKVEMPSPLEFIINGKRVRLWGGSMDPLQGYTHCYCRDRAMRLFDMAENANMNTLRIWGEGIPQPDEFYEEADRRGILIWQEFFLGHGAYPDTERIADECRKEAAALVKRLMHRPSLLMWCGGNETIMGAEFAGKEPFGKDIPLKVFPQVVEELDPGRYYHPNSPWGGEWANDPRTGDYHTYDCVWQYPYQDYPQFISEHIRTAPPVMHSLKKIIKGSIWPEDEKVSGWEAAAKQGLLSTYESPDCMPENWLQRSHRNANGQRKSGPYWEFYEPQGPEDMIYRFGAAYGQEIRRYGEQIRRGSRQPGESRRSKGYFSCKLLDTWPKVYCASIDFFQEGYIPYYSLVRLFQPVLLSFEKGESIRLWLVNDSDRDVEGTVTVSIYHLGEERNLRENQVDVRIGQGGSDMVFDLAEYQFFPKDCLLYAKFVEKNGDVCCSGVDYVDIERHLRYKEANLDVRLDGNYLVLKTDAFIRCVEIKGQSGEDEFGWLFSDNYFDLMPGEEKRVKILGNKDSGQLRIKGHYLQDEKVLSFTRKGL